MAGWFGDDDTKVNMHAMRIASELGISPRNAKMIAEIAIAAETLKADNAKLKSDLTESKESLRIANNDRANLIKQIEDSKNKFATGESVEAKYAKAMGALFAIAGSVSEESSIKIANGVIDELGERK